MAPKFTVGNNSFYVLRNEKCSKCRSGKISRPYFVPKSPSIEYLTSERLTDIRDKYGHESLPYQIQKLNALAPSKLGRGKLMIIKDKEEQPKLGLKQTKLSFRPIPGGSTIRSSKGKQAAQSTEEDVEETSQSASSSFEDFLSQSSGTKRTWEESFDSEGEVTPKAKKSIKPK
jgi:hypothetical protein